MPYDLTALDRVVDAVQECMCAALTAAAESLEDPTVGCPCLSCKAPGSPTWRCDEPAGDECASGQLNVSVNRLFPSLIFPSQDIGADGCAPSFIVAEISVLLLRCMPLESDVEEDCLPTCEQLAAAARIQHIDMLTIFRAATCCVPTQGLGANARRRRVAVASHRAVGPLGAPACVGSDLTLYVDIGSRCCDELPLPTPDPSA